MIKRIKIYHHKNKSARISANIAELLSMPLEAFNTLFDEEGRLKEQQTLHREVKTKANEKENEFTVKDCIEMLVLLDIQEQRKNRKARK